MSSKAQSYYGGADGGRYLLKFSKEVIFPACIVCECAVVNGFLIGCTLFNDAHRGVYTVQTS